MIGAEKVLGRIRKMTWFHGIILSSYPSVCIGHFHVHRQLRDRIPRFPVVTICFELSGVIIICMLKPDKGERSNAISLPGK